MKRVWIVLAVVLWAGAASAKTHRFHGGHHAHRIRVQPSPQPASEPTQNADDAYVQAQYGKHIGPRTKLPDTPTQKANKAH